MLLWRRHCLSWVKTQKGTAPQDVVDQSAARGVLRLQTDLRSSLGLVQAVGCRH